MDAAIAVCGGGTNTALPGRLPPSQVLRPPELARLLPAASPAREQHAVNLTDQRARQRKALRQLRRAIRQRGDVVRHPRPRRPAARPAPRPARTASGPTATTASPRSATRAPLPSARTCTGNASGPSSRDTPSSLPSDSPARSSSRCCSPVHASGGSGGNGSARRRVRSRRQPTSSRTVAWCLLASGASRSLKSSPCQDLSPRRSMPRHAGRLPPC
jgi:hypothetical protein